MIYIYGLIDPRTNDIRYVGQSVDYRNRLRQHIADGGNTPKAKWIAELASAKLEPQLVLLDRAEDKPEANYKEIWWIVFARRQGWHSVNGTFPSVSRAQFGDLFAEQLQAMYAEHQQVCEQLRKEAMLVQAEWRTETERLHGEALKLAVETERLKWWNRLSLTTNGFVVVFDLIGVVYFALGALAARQTVDVFMHWLLAATWLTFPVFSYIYYTATKMEREEGVQGNNYEYYSFRGYYAALGIAVVLFGTISLVELISRFL